MENKPGAGLPEEQAAVNGIEPVTDDLASERKADEERAARRKERLRAVMEERRRKMLRLKALAGAAGGLLAVLLLALVAGRVRTGSSSPGPLHTAASGSAGEGTVSDKAEAAATGSAETEADSLTEEAYAEALLAMTPVEEEQPEIDFAPYATEETKPTVLMDYSEIQVNGETLESKSLYEPWYNMDFGTGAHYDDAVDGILTFRGNSFRDNPTRGFANLTRETISRAWTKDTGTLDYNNRTWSGNGWTGQPLMMRWPAEVKAHMNLYESAKAEEDLVEVIYASMDGWIYFLNLKSGEATRDPMYVGWTFKGAGALDPRGYPILYVGSGYNSDNGVSRVFIINLLDCSIMYTFGNEDSFSLRGSLSFFDSSALVDAASDTLLYPGENGILYVMHLNTSYDPEAGTLSVDPDEIAKWHYMGKRSGEEKYWLGMEDSAAVYKGYAFLCDNGGHMMCINLNTLTFVWVQDILDDSNGSPVLSIEDGHLYLYVSTSFHLGWRSDDTATIPIWKIDAENGEIIWHRDYECYTEDGVSGGVQSTPAVGKYSLGEYLYVTVSMTLNETGGKCVCLSKQTGEVVWEHEAVYAWSSPVCVYNADGRGFVLYCASDGKMFLLNGLTGEVLDTYDFGDVTLEASPAVYDEYLVVGTRDCEICGFRLE